MCWGLFHNPQHDAAKAYVEADASCSVVCCGRDVFGKAYRPSVLAAKMVLYSGILAAVIGGIVASSLLVENGARADLIVWFVAFAFAAVATITSLYDITRHLLFYVQPELQLHYVRILWMVAIYAVESWLSLRFRSYAIYWETARECYEAFVLWSFYRLLLSFLAAEHGVGWTVTQPDGSRVRLETRWQAVTMGLRSDTVMGALLRRSCDEALRRRKAALEDGQGSKDGDDEILLSASGHGATPLAIVPESSGGAAGAVAGGTLVAEEAPLLVKHSAPLCCLPAWPMGTVFLHWTRWAVFQYVIVRIACTLLTVILTPLDLYGEGEFSNPAKFYMWSVIFINLSQCWALYCLLLVYLNFHEALRDLQPTKKFLVIKAVVFLCWWQSLVVAGMGQAGWLEGTATWSSEQIERGLQDFLICVEMALIAAVHHSVYSYRDFVPSDATEAPLLDVAHGSDDGKGGRRQAPAVGVGAAFPSQRPAAPSGRRPFMEALGHMMPVDVVREVPVALGPRQHSDTGIVMTAPGEDVESAEPARPAEAIRRH